MFQSLTDKEIEVLRDMLNDAWEATLHEEDEEVSGVWQWIDEIGYDLLQKIVSRKGWRYLYQPRKALPNRF